MSKLTNYGENQLVDWVRGQGITFPANWYFALGSAGSDAGITELSGTGYARVSVVRSLANFAGTQGAGTTLASSGSSHITSNNTDVDWGNPGSAWGTASVVGIFDASTVGNCWMWLPITALVITTGSPNPVIALASTLSFSVGLTGGMTDYLSNKLIDLMFRAQAYTWPATTYLGAYLTATTNAGGGTEVSASGYARASIASSLAAWCGTQGTTTTAASSGTSGRTSNNAALAFAAPSADWGTVTNEVLHDASTSGNKLFHGEMVTPRSILNGGPALTHAIDKISITFD